MESCILRNGKNMSSLPMRQRWFVKFRLNICPVSAKINRFLKKELKTFDKKNGKNLL